ncbi:MAG: hypothetical protein PVH84_13705 [Candidatus Aminicenantes bacterium]
MSSTLSISSRISIPKISITGIFGITLSAAVPSGSSVTFLMPRFITFIAHTRLRGLSSPFHSVPARHMEDLWIEEEK